MTSDDDFDERFAVKETNELVYSLLDGVFGSKFQSPWFNRYIITNKMNVHDINGKTGYILLSLKATFVGRDGFSNSEIKSSIRELKTLIFSHFGKIGG